MGCPGEVQDLLSCVQGQLSHLWQGVRDKRGRVSSLIEATAWQTREGGQLCYSHTLRAGSHRVSSGVLSRRRAGSALLCAAASDGQG